jgi:hypothetical protein
MPAQKRKTMNATALAPELPHILDGFAEANQEQAADTARIILSLREIGADTAVKKLEALIDDFNKDARRYREHAAAIRQSLTL